MLRPQKNPCLAAALDYLARGWSALPLCPPDHDGVPPVHARTCQRPGKGPLIAWKTYQERLPTERELRVYWARWPNANVGVVLGQVSRLIGVDLDGPEADALLEEISQGPLEPCLSFRTPGGGRRLLYELAEPITVARKRYDRGTSHVILLGEGTYSVMPPSVHPSGVIYQWETSPSTS